MHNVLDPMNTVPDEVEHLLSAGYDVPDDLSARVEAAAAAQDRGALVALVPSLEAVTRRSDWHWIEPSKPAEIFATIRNADAGRAWVGDDNELMDRIHGAVLGRAYGNVMGKPVEGMLPHEVRQYLHDVDAWPVTGFTPVPDVLPASGSRLHWSAMSSGQGRFPVTPRDDDLDYTVLGLYLLETHGVALTPADVTNAWLDRIPFTQTYTAERAAYRNLCHGLVPPATATYRNPYREWIGALIRADAFGYVYPGDPRSAVTLAVRDATVSHVENGIYGEMWAAALVSAAFTSPNVKAALQVALTWIPATSRLYDIQQWILALHATEVSWEAAFAEVRNRLAHYNWVHTLNNAAVIALALLWGDGDPVRSPALSVQSGWDTDSNTATVGSVVGALHGAAALPVRLTAPLNNRLRSAIRDFDNIALDEMATRLHRLASTIGRPQEHHGFD